LLAQYHSKYSVLCILFHFHQFVYKKYYTVWIRLKEIEKRCSISKI